MVTIGSTLSGSRLCKPLQTRYIIRWPCAWCVSFRHFQSETECRTDGRWLYELWLEFRESRLQDGPGMYGPAASDHTSASFQTNASSDTSEHADCVATEYISQFVTLLLFHSNTRLILPCAAPLPRLPQHR